MSARVMILGLDGVSWQITQKLMADGKMPTLRRMVVEGSSGPLYSTIPNISPTAWTTFMTGKSPGQHGLYGFAVKVEGSYMLEPFSAGRVKPGRTLWEVLSREGKRVAVFNVPMTFPAKPLNGIMVSGLGAPSEEAKHFCYPTNILNELRSELGPYIFDLHWTRYASRGVSAVVEDARKMTRCRADYGLKILQGSDWDLFSLVFVATDRLQHCAWKYLQNLEEPLSADEERVRSKVIDYYHYLDGVIAEFLAASSEADVLVMSDHGFGPCVATVQTNTWLGNEGFLTWTSQNAARHRGAVQLTKRLGIKRKHFRMVAEFLGLDAYRHLEKVTEGPNSIDWSKTRAFSYTPSGIYFNLKGRERQGIVEPGAEAEKLFDEIKERLLALRDPVTGNRVVLHVSRTHEVYKGAKSKMAPDLIVSELNDGYELNFSQRPAPEVFERSEWRSGAHHPEGLLVARGPNIKAGKRFDRAVLEDLCPTVLFMMNGPIPQDVDGRVLKEILTLPESEMPVVKTCAPEAETAAETLSAEEQEMVFERLKALGYFE